MSQSRQKKEASSLKTDEIEAATWQVPQNEQEVSQALSDGNSEVEEKKVVIPAKQKRCGSKYTKSPYIKKTPRKRAKRSAKTSKLNML